MPTVKKGDWIQMDASISGLDFSYSPDQALHVGHDIDVGLANAYLNDPPEEPRAHVISKEDGERLHNLQLGGIEPSQAREVPQRPKRNQKPAEPEPEPTPEPEEEPVHEEERSEQQGEEQATSPEAETRETAVQKRSRKRVKPPGDDEDDGETGFKD